MANHVHLLIRPAITPDLLLNSLKGATARYANRLLGRTGEPFWQKESYDHWVRNKDEFEKIRAYIEANPVKAGLVRNPRDFPWSSAERRDESRRGTHECVRHLKTRYASAHCLSRLW
jgi:REP element-mobilizing transposase RayT